MPLVVAPTFGSVSDRAQFIGPLGKAALHISGRRLGEDVVEEKVLQLHHEMVEQRLFLPFLQWLGDFFPFILELGELRLPHLREQQVLQQIHRVEADAALVDRLEDF